MVQASDLGAESRWVAPGTMSLRHGHVEGNTGLILGDRGVLAVDTGPDISHRQTVQAAIDKIDKPFVGTVLTHFHWDHVWGGSPIADREVFAHRLTTGLMTNQIGEWAQKRSLDAETLSEQLPWPTVGVEGVVDISLGDRLVRLIPTPGHSPDSLCVYVEDCGVLFGGDTVVTCIPPVFRDGNSSSLETSLSHLSQLDISVLVPGHGAIQEDGSATDWLRWAISYVSDMRQAVDGMATATADEIAAQLSFERMIGERLPVELHQMRWRHEQTVENLLREINN